MDEDSLLGRAKTCCLVSINENIEEARELCRTLGIEVVKNIVQRRTYPDPHTFIGTGKLEELKEISNEVDLFVFDGELKPSQHFRLETTLKKLCTDRVGLVLEIFERNAGSKEAKAQVALARIRYELPFLREWVSKGLSDDRPGFMAGGEYVIDAYYENARRQMKRIESELLRISAERESRRDRRRDRGFYLVSICGYTNGGKSTLLNLLSGADTVVDDKMFSTLSTMTRRMCNSGMKVLLTDTVGFIRHLPPDLIDAFDATLEEIFNSDCALLVLDFSNRLDEVVEKLQTSLKILVPKIDPKKIIIVLNKIDALSVDDLQNKMNLIEESIVGFTFYLISSKTGIGKEELIRGILNKLGLAKNIEIVIKKSSEGQEFYKWISQRLIIMDAEWNENIRLQLQVTDEEIEMLRSRVEASNEATIRILP